MWEIDIDTDRRRYIVELDRVEEGRDGYTPTRLQPHQSTTYHVGPGIDGGEEVVVRPLLPRRKPAEDVLFDLGLQLTSGKRQGLEGCWGGQQMRWHEGDLGRERGAGDVGAEYVPGHVEDVV